MRRAVAFASVALVAASAACSRGEPTPPESSTVPEEAGARPASPPPSPASTGVSTAASPGPDGGSTPSAVTRLLDAGASPRRKLRHVWRLGQRELLTMELRTSASTEENGETTPEVVLPPVRIALAVEPRTVSPSGDLTYAWRVTSTNVTADEPSMLADGMRAEVAAVEHLAGTATVTPLGLSTDIVIEPSSYADASAPGTTGQMVEQVRQTLRDLAAPFPEEPVGKGARWERLSRLATRDARIQQTDTYTLVDTGSDSTRGTGVLDDILAQTAPPQPLRGTGAGPDTSSSARMDSMLASGDGKIRFDPSRLVPETHFDGTTTMVVSGDDGAHRRTMIMRVGIVIGGALAAEHVR